MTTDLKNKLAVAKTASERGEALDQRGAPTSVMGFLTHPNSLKQVERMLGSKDMAERWLRIGLTEARRVTGKPGRNNGLADCSMESFAGALMQCAMLKLEPGPPLGLAWILPYENRVQVQGRWQTRMDAQFQLGYPGIIQLAHRSGQLAGLAAHEVCENDEFGFDYLTGEKHHRPPYKGERGDAYGFYCFAKYANGGEHFLYMTREQVEAHARRFSKAYQYDVKRQEGGEDGFSPWSTDFVPMGRKTTIKQSRPFLPASPDFVTGLQADERIIRADFDRGQLVIDEEGVEIALSAPRPDAIENGEEAGEAKAEEPKQNGDKARQESKPTGDDEAPPLPLDRNG